MIEVRWYHITRAIGVGLFAYALLFDRSPERGTIMLTGAGLAGFDRVSRSEPELEKKGKNK